jgi:hypothetical protein
MIKMAFSTPNSSLPAHFRAEKGLAGRKSRKATSENSPSAVGAAYL